ncbi:MAG TPA: biopolymer transporter ExbD [Cyclobacteriaceae bacterium]|nr:biopolymer transporter ExbD [Cyclobacteriaceae bacterium]
MTNRRDRRIELSTSSMADIAFLMLTFFLISTQIPYQRGLVIMLPELNNVVNKKIHDRNLFAIQLNSEDRLMVEGEVRPVTRLREAVRAFILNTGRDKSLSDNPRDAVVSFKADRQTSHRAFIEVLDEIQAAYFEIYAARAGMSSSEFRALNPTNPLDKEVIDRAREGFPMNVSIAEPTRIRPKGLK